MIMPQSVQEEQEEAHLNSSRTTWEVITGEGSEVLRDQPSSNVDAR